MSVRLTREVAEQPLPKEWRGGSSYPAVEQIAEGLTNPWSIAPDVARVLARIVVEGRRTRILEYGAGMSSRIFAAALEEIGGGRLTSVEENTMWCKEAWTHIEQMPDVDARLIPASVHLKVNGKGIYYGYAQTDEISRRGPYDLVFVDAPWGGYGRDGGLHAAYESLEYGGLIVLDDARRIRERRTVRRWVLNYPDLTIVANDPSVGRGLSILKKQSESTHNPSVVSTLAEVWGSGIFDLVRKAKSIRAHRLRAQEEMRDAG